MATKRLLRKPKRELSEEDIRRYAEEWLREKEAAEAMMARANEKKATLVEYVMQHGYEDDKGSRYIDIEIPGLKAIKYEKRHSVNFDDDKAEAWLKKQPKLNYDDFTETIVRVDRDKVLAAGYEGTISEKTIKSFYVTSETFAFKAVTK